MDHVMSLSGEAFLAQCIVYFVLVKMSLWCHYPSLKGLRFLGLARSGCITNWLYNKTRK